MTDPSNSPFKIAIIGAGLIGPRHAQTVSSNPSTTLCAVVDPTESGVKLARRYNAPHFTSLTSLLTSGHKPDAAIICTPNHTHVPLGLECVRAGVHILVEKPIANDVASGRELVKAAREAGVKILVGHHRRFNSSVIAAKKVLGSGVLGRPIAVNGLWMTFKPSAYFSAPAAWRAQAENGGGVILINMIHEIDVFHHLLGPITRVYCEATPAQRHRPEEGHEHTAEEGAAITLRFRSGVVGTFLVCDATPSPHNFESATGENPLIPRMGQDIYRIFGTDGTLSVPDLDVSSYHGRPQKSWHETMSVERWEDGEMPAVARRPGEDEKTPFERQLEHFVKVLDGIEEPMCSGADGLAALVVCDALKRSIDGGKPIETDINDVR